MTQLRCKAPVNFILKCLFPSAKLKRFLNAGSVESYAASFYLQCIFLIYFLICLTLILSSVVDKIQSTNTVIHNPESTNLFSESVLRDTELWDLCWMPVTGTQLLWSPRAISRVTSALQGFLVISERVFWVGVVLFFMVLLFSKEGLHSQSRLSC